MNIQRQKIELDITKNNYKSAWGIKGDIGTRELDLYIFEGESIFDLTGLQVLFYAETPNGSKKFDDVEITNAELGKLYFKIPQQILGQVGTTKCCLVFREGEKQLISYNFTINVSDSIYDEGAIIVSDDFSALTKALNEVQNIEPNYTPRLTALEQKQEGFTSQLDSNMNENFIIFNNLKKSKDIKTKFIAHRGAEGYAPENSLPAYEIAGKIGFWGVETDLLCTKDNVWVLMHDSDIDRTTNGTGNVTEITYEYIRSCVIDTGNNVQQFPNEKVPSLDEFLICCKRYNLYPFIEIKAGSFEQFEILINKIKQHGLISNCVIMSFNVDLLRQIRKINKLVELNIVFGTDVTDTEIDIAKELIPCNLNCSGATKEGIIKAHENGLTVCKWTVNDMPTIRNYVNNSIDFITSSIFKEVF